ncbi:MAG: MBG domain-containing protein, partial [Clostridia bacterium]|nr:MBG domain-containing protein [Clostridia bacterium]
MSEKRKKASIGEYRLNFDYSNSTIKRIKSLTWIVLAAGGIAAFADLFLLINIAVKYTNLATFPIILFVLDIAFIAASAISNYRFKYSAHIWRAYVFLSLLFSLIMTIGPYWNSAQRYMTGTAFALIIISRIVSLAILVVAINIAKKKITKNTLNLAIGLLAVIFVVGIGYTAYNGAVGFHGQNIGITAEDMTIVYEYDSSEGYYIASGVLEGEGNQITVPLTFDGSPVGAIDCSIFKETEAQKVSILGDSKLSLLNLENLESINSGITFEVHKDLIDVYRYEILNSFSSISVSLANAMVPHSLEEDEVYITFAYSETNYIYGKPIVPTWIGETGSSFSLEYLADREGFLPYSNYNLESDLAWNYANNNNKVLRLYKPSGETLTEENVTRSINKAQIDFEKIFNVRMLTGNDNKYNIPSSWASVGSYNGRYMIESQFQEIYNDLPSRNGFSVSWAFVSSTGSSTYSEIQSVDVFSSFMKSSAGSLFQIKPTWTVKAPSISKVSSGRTNNSFTYGENISISTSATSQGLPIKYKLKKSGLTVAESTNGSFLLQTYLPSQSGVYTVEAWSENSSLSSLKSQVVTKSINLVINKKSLQFAWTLPDDDSYDGNSKTLTCFLDDQLVGSDILDFSYTFFDTGVIDAGDYTSEITLSSSSAEKYSVKSGYETANFTILPMTIEATWGSNIFTYNGEPQKPIATATGIPEDGALEVIISGEMINVGEYVSSASLTNTNYVLSNPTSQFIINRREITVVWDDVAFIYNGISQHPFVAEINNEVEGEEDSIISSLSYKDYDQNINKGEGYTVESTLPSESNYVFNVSQIGTYTIGKRPINVIWQTEDSFVYNGEEQRRSVSAFDDIVPGEETATLGLLVYPSGYKDVGNDYSFGVTIQEECNYIFLDIQTTTFSITPKEVSITADSLQKTYNGNAYEYTFTYSVSGLEGLDTELDLGTITPSNNAVDAINAGEYTISQIISLENRGAEYDNYTIYYVDATLTIYPKELTITTLTTSNNGVKIYDGQTYTDLDYDNSTLAPTDILSDILTLTYTGEGVTAINYRSTPYTVTASLDSEGTKYSNYQIEYIPAYITIEKREITVGKISSPVLTKEYDGNLSTSYDFSYNTDYELIGADIGTEITGATKGTSYDQKGVGATKIIVTFGNLIGGTGYIASNYDFVGGQYLEYEASITPKSLDIVAEDKEKTYDGTPYSGFTVSAEGLVAGDSVSDVVTISYFGDGTTAVNHSETQYTVTPGIQDQGSLYSNYNISFYSGGVTINQRPLTLSADNKSKPYDGFTFSEFSVSPSGLA